MRSVEMWRLRHVSKVFLAVFAALACGELESMTWRSHQNILDQVGMVLFQRGGHINEHGCHLQPAVFDPASTFYIMKCIRGVDFVNIIPQGKFVYIDGVQNASGNPYKVTLGTSKKTHLVEIHSCDHEVQLEADRRGSKCRQIRIDIFRSGDDVSSLATLAASGKELMPLRPVFHSSVVNYHTHVELNSPFTISAAAAQINGIVGIEFVGDSGHGGLGGNNGCELGTKKSTIWHLEGFQATGSFKYKICALAADLADQKTYYLTVKCTPVYSARLKSIDAGKYSLQPLFSPQQQTYTIMIPTTLSELPISVTTVDMQASVRFLFADLPASDKGSQGNTTRGHGSINVAMKDNSHLKKGQTPQWTRSVDVKVKAADGSMSLSYVIIVKQEVSTFSELKNILVGDETPCTLKPKFSPSHRHYTCTWWWDFENGTEIKNGSIIPIMDVEGKCDECSLLAPDDKAFPKSDIDYDSAGMDRIHWKTGKKWSRPFKYREVHPVPFQVVSADKFTSTTYWVTLTRDCPWWMATWLTRLVSKTATALAMIMAVSSITNVMALAKQVQFMSLTTEIDGVPPVYVDFCHSLKDFNFDAFDYLPFDKLGIPTMASLKKMKKDWVSDLKKKLGIEHASLLLQYCGAMRLAPNADKGDLLYPNAILDRQPQKSKDLMRHLAEHTKKMKEEAAHKKAAAPHKKDSEGSEATGDGKDKKQERRLLDFLSPLTYPDLIELNSSPDDADQHSSQFLSASRVSGGASGNPSDASERAALDALLGEDLHLDLEEHGRRLAEKNYDTALELTEDDYNKILAIAMKKEGMTRDKLRHKWPLMSCANKQIVLVEDALVTVHQLLEVRKMLSTTTGTFLILTCGVIAAGSFYMFIYASCMRGRQRRPRILEPAPLIIFVCDYILIAFAKSASKVAFRPTQMQLLSFSPSMAAIRTACFTGLVLYPVNFCGFIGGRIWTLMNQHRLVWNPEFEKFTDPRCNSIKVTLAPSFIPAFIPALPALFTYQVRACIPILNSEGEKLDFEASENMGELKKEEKEKQGDPEQIQDMQSHDIQDELKKLDAELVTHIDDSVLLHKQKDLKDQADEFQKAKTRLQDHKKTLRMGKSQTMDRNMANSNISDDKANFPPWFPPEPDKEGDKEEWDKWSEDDVYKITKLTDITDKFVSRKHRSPLERLDAEEKFAMRQWIDQNIRQEKKLKKYGILEVIAANGYLCPQEPLLDYAKTGRLWVDNKEGLKNPETGFAYDGPDKLGKDDLGKYELGKLGMADLVKEGKLERDCIDDLVNERNLVRDDAGNLDFEFEAPMLSRYLDYGHAAQMMNYPKSGEQADDMHVIKCIDDDIGQRLVYLGNDGWGKDGWTWFKGLTGAPGGSYGGEAMWKAEPDEGWDEWYIKSKKATPTLRYADKWQWLYFNEDQPWNEDDEHEGELNLRCFILRKKDVFFWNEFSKMMIKRYDKRVPFRVLGEEKQEIRKWMWTQLREKALIKLKLVHMADQHPKFYPVLLNPKHPEGKEYTATDAIQMPFLEVFQRIEIGKQGKNQLLKSEKFTDARNELMEFTLMKVEDTVPFEEKEPWMLAVDPAGVGEYRIQFDHDLFWMGQSDQELADVRKEAPLIPKTGYSTCREFMSQPHRQFGVKRYTLYKPDGTRSKIKLNVQMKHVLPLMRYTTAFKCNVEHGSLDMPYRDEYNLVIGHSQYGEQYNYVIERVATLISIILLAGDPGGMVCAFVFLCTKGMSWLTSVFNNFQAMRYEDKGAENTAKREYDREMEEQRQVNYLADEEQALLVEGAGNQITEAMEQAMQEENLQEMNDKKDEGWKAKFQGRSTNTIIGWSLINPDCMILGLQVGVLALLSAGQVGMPPPLCAICCIVVSAITMMLMNVKTFGKQVRSVIEDLKSRYQAAIRSFRSWKSWTFAFLNGDNFLGYQFMVIEDSAEFEKTADAISIVVGELGLTLDGEPEIPGSLPPEEIRARSMFKKVVPYVMEIEDPEDKRMRSAKDHYRFEADIATSLYIALETDQMMMRKGLAQIVATLQCLNHPESDLSNPQYDSFLTLVKQLPGGEPWQDEFDTDKEKIKDLLSHWKNQVEDWLDHGLGAVESEKTATKRIKENLQHMLANECTGQVSRDMYKIKIPKITIPKTDKMTCKCKDLQGKLGYVRILYDLERIPQSFPTDRVTMFGTFQEVEPEEDNIMVTTNSMSKKRRGSKNDDSEDNHNDQDDNVVNEPLMRKEYELRVDEDMDVMIPVGVTELKLVVMVQDADARGVEELVAFTEDLDIGHIAPDVREGGGNHEPAKMILYTRWTHRARDITPFGDWHVTKDKQNRADLKRRREEAAMSFGQKFKLKMKNCFRGCFQLFVCGFCSPEPTRAEVKKFYGKAYIRGRKFSHAEEENDIVVLNHLTALTGGDSAMNLEKIRRHKDQWLALADFFGIIPTEDDLTGPKGMEKHLALLKKVQGLMEAEIPTEIRKLEEDMKDMAKLIQNAMSGIDPLGEMVRKLRSRSATLTGEAVVKAMGGLFSSVMGSSGGSSSELPEPDESPSNAVGGPTAKDDDPLQRAYDNIDKLKAIQKHRDAKMRTTGAYDRRKNILLQNKMRRPLENSEEMADSIARLEAQIADHHSRAAKRPQGIVPNHEVMKLNIGGRTVKTFEQKDEIAVNATTDESEQVTVIGRDLLAKLWEYQQAKMTGSKQILHFVIVSDQLKPSKLWRPDVIVPHVAQILSRQFEDMDEVKVVFGAEPPAKAVEVTFKREQHHKSKTPALVHGRLAFLATQKAVINEETGAIDFSKRGWLESAPGAEPVIQHDMYLYWDGRMRWVISPRKGEPPPYGMNKEEVLGFIWAQDSAITPDKITREWCVWHEVQMTTDHIQQMETPWKADPHIKVHGANIKPAATTDMVAEKSMTQFQSQQNQSGMATLCKELYSMVGGASTIQADPEMRDCLCALTSEHLMFSWKDLMIERLAPFRKFLLTEFGSYNRAWLYMTRNKTFAASTGQINLAIMLKDSYDVIKAEIKKSEEEELERIEAEEKEKAEAEELAQQRAKMAERGMESEGTMFSVRSGESVDAGEGVGGMDDMHTETLASRRAKAQEKEMARSATEKSEKEANVLKAKKQRSLRKGATRSISRKSHKASTSTVKLQKAAPKTQASESAVLGSMDKAHVMSTNDLDLLIKFLDDNIQLSGVEPGMEFSRLAEDLMTALDRDIAAAQHIPGGDGQISVGEVHDLYEEPGSDGAPEEPRADERDRPEPLYRTKCLLWDFSKWIRLHPWYRDVACFWGELSEGVEVNIAEFSESMQFVLQKFLAKAGGQKSATDVGVSFHDEQNQVTIRSADWRLPKSFEQKDRDNRTLAIKFKVQGKHAFSHYSKLDCYFIRVEGHIKKYTPILLVKEKVPGMPEAEVVDRKNGPVMKSEENTNAVCDVQHCTLLYEHVPFGRLMYFKYSGNDAHLPGHKAYKEFSFRGNNPGAPDEKAKSIFADLDVQMSNGVSRKELIPHSGEDIDSVDQCMLQFKIPLAHIAEICPDPVKTQGTGDDTKRVVKAKVNKQFAGNEEWSRLKTALDPEWKCVDPENEEVHFCMLPEYWDLWYSVISACQMTRSQEWVRFYDGGYMEHPNMRGLYMRHGYGIQRWANGQVFVGNWKYHVYDGEGTLWSKWDDWMNAAANKVVPLYSGNFSQGTRNGWGTLNWEQDVKTFEKKGRARQDHGKGIHKCYYGEFKDGLFNGKGTLILKGAMSQSIPSHLINVQATGLRNPAPPQLQPTQILRFEGRFRSDYTELYNEFIEGQYDPEFTQVHMDPLEGDFCDPIDVETGLMSGIVYPSLRLETMTKVDEQSKTEKHLRYFEKDSTSVQKAGLPMPDLGLMFYRYKIKGIPAECYHLQKGTATYADGSQYYGDFKLGMPCGKGKLCQFQEPSTNREPVAVYDGDWNWKERKIEGVTTIVPVREGHGEYTITEQLRYNGAWLDDQRSGEGYQEISTLELQTAMGYKRYTGNFENDKRHGYGTMTIAAVDPDDESIVTDYKFQGNFEAGKRNGQGTMLRLGIDTDDGALEEDYGGVETHIAGADEDGQIPLYVYNGDWLDDNISATAEKPAWSYLGESIYFGALNADGDREGYGTLYSKAALQDKDFCACFQASTLAERMYKPTNAKTDVDKHRFKLYEGKWEKNLPHGEGAQFFEHKSEKSKKVELQTYTGSFVKGKRHGRGNWDGLDSSNRRWKYRPIQGHAHNWADDKMHGIATVEDAEHVHENVIYTDGVCQMPFTRQGPPMTGFKDKSALGGVVGTLKKGRVLARSYGDKKSLEDGMEVVPHGVMKGGHRSQYTLANPDVAQATRAQALGVLVRQPTDLTMPEEDVLVSGGKDGNQKMNGLYFKMSGTFGVPIYKHSIASKAKDLDGHAIFDHMFLYRDTKKEKWMISDSPANDSTQEMLRLSNCAMVDSAQETPGRIEKPWHVWHEDTAQMRVWGDDDKALMMPKGLIFKQDMSPIDKIEVSSVVGFEVTGYRGTFISSLLLRHPSLYFGRPVYEAENGGQYLYWQAQDAPSGAGVVDASMSGPGQVAYHEDVYKVGWWILAAEVGLRPEDSRTKACVEDNAMTPHQIKEESQWLVRDPKPNGTEPGAEAERKQKRSEEWRRKAHSPITPGQIVTVKIDSFSGNLPTHEHEDCAIDFLDVSGNIVLRWGLIMRRKEVTLNSYDAVDGRWGEAQRQGLLATDLSKPLPMVKFEMKADGWEVRTGTEEPITFKHRPTLNVTHDGENKIKVIAPPVAVKVSENCDVSKIETILFEDSGADTWQDCFEVNKMMKLKLEFWTHDTKTGLDLLDGAKKVGALDQLGDAAKAARDAFHGAIGGIFGTMPLGGEADQGKCLPPSSSSYTALAIEDTGGLEEAGPSSPDNP